jgi:hypothetical protein
MPRETVEVKRSISGELTVTKSDDGRMILQMKNCTGVATDKVGDSATLEFLKAFGENAAAGNVDLNMSHWLHAPIGKSIGFELVEDKSLNVDFELDQTNPFSSWAYKGIADGTYLPECSIAGSMLVEKSDTGGYVMVGIADSKGLEIALCKGGKAIFPGTQVLISKSSVTALRDGDNEVLKNRGWKTEHIEKASDDKFIPPTFKDRLRDDTVYDALCDVMWMFRYTIEDIFSAYNGLTQEERKAVLQKHFDEFTEYIFSIGDLDTVSASTPVEKSNEEGAIREKEVKKECGCNAMQETEPVTRATEKDPTAKLEQSLIQNLVDAAVAKALAKAEPAEPKVIERADTTLATAPDVRQPETPIADKVKSVTIEELDKQIANAKGLQKSDLIRRRNSMVFRIKE